jgi:hypothetical protein
MSEYKLQREPIAAIVEQRNRCFLCGAPLTQNDKIHRGCHQKCWDDAHD